MSMLGVEKYFDEYEENPRKVYALEVKESNKERIMNNPFIQVSDWLEDGVVIYLGNTPKKISTGAFIVVIIGGKPEKREQENFDYSLVKTSKKIVENIDIEKSNFDSQSEIDKLRKKHS